MRSIVLELAHVTKMIVQCWPVVLQLPFGAQEGSPHMDWIAVGSIGPYLDPYVPAFLPEAAATHDPEESIWIGESA
jgi:hypothetical protein